MTITNFPFLTVISDFPLPVVIPDIFSLLAIIPDILFSLSLPDLIG